VGVASKSDVAGGSCLPIDAAGDASMEARRFDQIARELGAGLPRRGLLGWLLALLSGPLLPWRAEEAAEAAGRRKRRKRRHKHGQPGSPDKRKRRNQRTRQKRRTRRTRRKRHLRRKKGAICQPGKPCGAPGQVCRNDGSCACVATSCPQCQICNAVSGLCEPDADAAGDPCGEPIQVCQPDGTCACPDSASGCGGVCGCEGDFICDEGACQPCDVTFDGNSISSGAALQTRLQPPGGTIRVCPGRYQHRFVLDTIDNVNTSYTVIGAGDGGDEETSTILDAGGSGRTLTVNPDVTNNRNVTASLRGVRITGGNERLGGGIFNNGRLTLTACTIGDNDADLGGGIYNSFDSRGQLELIDCRVTENRASDNGGGIHNNSIFSLPLSGCTIAENRSDQNGGGIFNNGSVLDITGSEIGDNRAGGDGGGIHNNNPVTTDPGRVTFDAASSVRNNTAGADGGGTGGGIFNASNGTVPNGTVTLNGAAVTDNEPNNCAGAPVTGCVEDP
jgi:hypothetical protein